jgi:hypothetical protein
MRRSLLPLLLLGVATLAWAPAARADAVPTGTIVERVATAADASQTYALYLPSSYTPARKWPILYCFDPGARGKVAVEHFRAAAETYGYVVVGSNNSRNGIAVRDIVNALWLDTHTRFAIDDRRVYVAGFSGGARVASALAIGTAGQVAGVIGCGAGYPSDAVPTKGTPFAFFGTAGVDDFNLPEMRHLADALAAAGIAHRVEVWDGPHEWAPAELCTIGVEWMELRAMRGGTREKDPALLDAWARRDEERARAREAKGAVVDAVAAYAALAADFEGLRDTSAYAAAAARLRESKAYKDAVKAERDDETKQRQATGEIVANLRQLDDAENRPLALQNIHRLVAALRKKLEGGDTRDAHVARRSLNESMVAAFQTSSAQSDKKDYARAAATLSVADEIRPNSPGLLYNLACLNALAGDRKRAIDALRRAVASGYADVAALETDKDLDAIRDAAEFKAIVDGVRAKPATP